MICRLCEVTGKPFWKAGILHSTSTSTIYTQYVITIHIYSSHDIGIKGSQHVSRVHPDGVRPSVDDEPSESESGRLVAEPCPDEQVVVSSVDDEPSESESGRLVAEPCPDEQVVVSSVDDEPSEPGRRVAEPCPDEQVVVSSPEADDERCNVSGVPSVSPGELLSPRRRARRASADVRGQYSTSAATAVAVAASAASVAAPHKAGRAGRRPRAAQRAGWRRMAPIMRSESTISRHAAQAGGGASGRRVEEEAAVASARKSRCAWREAEAAAMRMPSTKHARKRRR